MSVKDNVLNFCNKTIINALKIILVTNKSSNLVGNTASIYSPP